MKKIVMVVVVLLSVVFFSSCTDSDLKDLEQRNETQLQLTTPSNNGGVGQGGEEEETGDE